MRIRTLFCLFLAVFALAGCGMIYKQNIQQGNAIEQEDLDELYIGMNERQVLFVLGTPSVRDPFHPDRWDYVQTFSRRGNEMVKRTVTLRFEDGLLSEIVGLSDPFAATSGSTTGGGALAAFVKKPEDGEEADSDAAAPGSSGSPQDEALQSAEEEILGGETEIDTIEERTARDRDYERSQDLLDQTPDDNPIGPDIDG